MKGNDGGALRLPGVKALNNMICDEYSDYLWLRSSVGSDTVGTTGNEAFHHIPNGRLHGFGDARTYATGSQLISIGYQYNYAKLNAGNSKDSYWVPIELLPLDRCCYMDCHPMLCDMQLEQQMLFSFKRKSVHSQRKKMQ